MKTISHEGLKNLDFSDHDVLSMNVNFKKKEIIINLVGVYVNLKNEWKDIDGSKIYISNWKKIDISMYDAHKKIWQKFNEENFDILKDICEFDPGNDIKLCGFGKKSGYWIEYKINSPKIEVEIENWPNEAGGFD